MAEVVTGILMFGLFLGLYAGRRAAHALNDLAAT
jgi:hypothetical protein